MTQETPTIAKDERLNLDDLETYQRVLDLEKRLGGRGFNQFAVDMGYWRKSVSYPNGAVVRGREQEYRTDKALWGMYGLLRYKREKAAERAAAKILF